MGLKQISYSVLVVSSSEKFNIAMAEILRESGYTPVKLVSDISSAKREVSQRSYDMVIINSPLADDMGTNFAIDVSSMKGTVVLMLIRGEIYEDLRAKLVPSGVFTLQRPTSKQMIGIALNWLICARERIRRYEDKTLTLEEKMEEIRIVNRAKWILINSLRMDEPTAHRYIEKAAMDRCVTKRQVAEEIIKNYT